MVKKMQLGTKTLHCFSECPDIAGVELQTVINSALRQLNMLIDNTYNAYKSKYPMATRPKLYVYIVENKIDEINAFTDGQDIYIAAACMIGFRVLDMSKEKNRRILIDMFINRIYLYDDKLVSTFNHKDGIETITLNDIEAALAEAENGSDLVSFAVTKNADTHLGICIFCYPEGTRRSKFNSPAGCWAMGRDPSLHYAVPQAKRHQVPFAHVI